MILAIVQDGPVYNDLKQTIEKTCDIISAAKKKGAELVVFGESWLCGYPAWLDVCSNAGLWNHDPVKVTWQKMYENAIELHSPEMDQLKKHIKATDIWTVIGANERISKGPGNGTMFNSVFTVSNRGEISNHHRKLMPTYTEKLVHGLGDGAGLNSVTTPFGNLGALICWEHWMPLTRQAMHQEAENLHIALWPYVKDMHQICSRQYAFEGRCHVVSVGQIMQVSEIPNGLEIPKHLQPNELLLKGGSSIYGPDGTIVLEPQYMDRKIIYQEVDTKSNAKEKMNLAVAGHYSRPDVFRMDVNKSRQF